MAEAPSGSLFVRQSTSSSAIHKRATGVYGLLALRRGITGERQYWAHWGMAGASLAIDTKVAIEPSTPDHERDDSALHYLAMSSIWPAASASGSGLMYLRKTPYAPLADGKELYLAVGVFQDTQSGRLPNESVIDIKDGDVTGMLDFTAAAAGLQPTQVLGKPFFKMSDGSRTAVWSTLEPSMQASIREIRDLCTTPPDDLSDAAKARLEQMRANWKLRSFIQTYEREAEFVAFTRAMAPHAMPEDRLLTVSDLARHKTAADIVIRTVMAERIGEASAPIRQSRMYRRGA